MASRFSRSSLCSPMFPSITLVSRVRHHRSSRAACRHNHERNNSTMSARTHLAAASLCSLPDAATTHRPPPLKRAPQQQPPLRRSPSGSTASSRWRFDVLLVHYVDVRNDQRHADSGRRSLRTDNRDARYRTRTASGTDCVTTTSVNTAAACSDAPTSPDETPTASTKSSARTGHCPQRR